MKTDIDRVVAEIAPAPGHGITPGARELLKEITTSPPTESGSMPKPSTRIRWIRRRITLPLAAGLAALAIVLTWLVPGSLGIGPRPAAALDIKRQGDYYVITVKDLFADPERYEAQLRSLGINVSLRLVPATRGFEGKILTPFTPHNEITAIQSRGVCAEHRQCPIGLKIRVGYQGKALIQLGRIPRPGERVADPTMYRLDMPGQPFHCVAYINKTVDQVRAMLKKRGVTISWFADYKTSWSSVPGSWYVHEGITTMPGEAGILAVPYPHPNPPGQWAPETCPKRS
jgi:hypothetical protein